MYLPVAGNLGEVYEVVFLQKKGRDSSFKEMGKTMYNKAIRNKQFSEGEVI